MTVSSSPHLWQRSRESCSSRLGSGGCLPGSLQSLRRLTCDFSLACRGLPPSSGLQTVRRQNTVAYLKSRGAGAGVNVLEGIFVDPSLLITVRMHCGNKSQLLLNWFRSLTQDL